MSRHTNIPEVQIIFQKGNMILLNLRQNTGYMDGWYGLVAGHVEEKETFTQAGIREAKEEAGVNIHSSNMAYVHTVHRILQEREDRVGVIFIVQVWDGEIYNAEPEKSAGLFWYNISELPDNTIPYIKTCIENIQKKLLYTEVDS